MTLRERFEKLTPTQREQFANLKDEAQLTAFAFEQGIELTGEEVQGILVYIKTGVLPLEDDELDAAAGGVSASKEKSFARAETQANSDGRIYNLPPASLTCACNHKYKWAKTKVIDRDGISTLRYNDIKCYKCGRSWEEKRIPI